MLTRKWRQKQLDEINRFARAVRDATPIKMERPIFLKLAFTLLEGLVIGNAYGNPTGTPVKTGHARAQWHMSLGAPTVLEGEAPDPSGALTMAREAAKLFGLDLRAKPIVFFTAGAPYTIYLEYGHSLQAPSGMVRILVSNYDRLLADIVAWAKANEPQLLGTG